jgi:hypothetical protein
MYYQVVYLQREKEIIQSELETVHHEVKRLKLDISTLEQSKKELYSQLQSSNNKSVSKKELEIERAKTLEYRQQLDMVRENNAHLLKDKEISAGRLRDTKRLLDEAMLKLGPLEREQMNLVSENKRLVAARDNLAQTDA